MPKTRRDSTTTFAFAARRPSREVNEPVDATRPIPWLCLCSNVFATHLACRPPSWLRGESEPLPTAHRQMLAENNAG